MKYECWAYKDGKAHKMVNVTANDKSEAEMLAWEKFRSIGVEPDYVKCKQEENEMGINTPKSKETQDKKYDKKQSSAVDKAKENVKEKVHKTLSKQLLSYDN